MKSKIFGVLIWIVSIFIYYYFMLPPIHIQSISFWGFVIFALITGSICLGFSDLFDRKPKLSRISMVMVSGCVLIFIGIVFVNFIYSPFFRANMYSKRIEIDMEGDFQNDIEEVDFEKIPLLDKDSSRKLGDRVMGQMPEMVSQFYVSNLYTQINYQNKIVRVTPLEYNGLFKYINNHKDGIKGYIEVNSTTGESSLVKLEKGMKYVPSAILNEDLYRYLRFLYPFEIFGEETFEVDEEGNPYWIVPVMSYKAIGLATDISGVVLLDPISGEAVKYSVEEIPKWVDHVYSASLILEQVDDWGCYKEGFLNSIFGQKNVVMTTDGYNYLANDDDVYLYTGITSVSSDEANIGFILTNMRTKETVYYPVAGAEEYSAMDSARGQVQQMKYTPTFPLLINLNGKPTYLISLKDDAGLVKMYAFVDVVDYQKVTVEDASLGIEKIASIFLGNEYVAGSSNAVLDEITINKITTVVIDGVSYYYLVDSNGEKYKVSIKVEKDLLPFIQVGDKLKIYYKEKEEVTSIIKIEK